MASLFKGGDQEDVRVLLDVCFVNSLRVSEALSMYQYSEDLRAENFEGSRRPSTKHEAPRDKSWHKTYEMAI